MTETFGYFQLYLVADSDLILLMLKNVLYLGNIHTFNVAQLKNNIECECDGHLAQFFKFS